MCNSTVAMLSLNTRFSPSRYNLAITMAANVARRCMSLPQEAKDYANSRWSCITGFRTGQALRDAQEHGSLTDVQAKEMYRLIWELMRNKGRAHIGLCMNALVGEGIMLEENMKIARVQREEARSSE